MASESSATDVIVLQHYSVDIRPEIKSIRETAETRGNWFEDFKQFRTIFCERIIKRCNVKFYWKDRQEDRAVEGIV